MLKIISRSGNIYYYNHINNNFYTGLPEIKDTIFSIDFDDITSEHLSNPIINSLIINLTNNCNMRGQYCAYSGAYYYQRTHEKRHIKSDIAKRAIDIYLDHSRNGERSIIFYGGEPTTAPDLLIELAKYINNKDYSTRLYLNTNLLYIDDNLLNFIINTPFTIYVSINGYQSIHDKYRVDINGKPTFNRVKNNLQRIYNINSDYYKSHIAFIATLTRPYNIDDVRILYDSEEIFQQPWIVSSVVPFDNNFTDDIDPFNYDEYCNSLIRLADDYINAVISGEGRKHFGHWVFGQKLSKIYHRDMKENTPLPINNCCIPGVEKLFVDCDGKFYFCEKNTSLVSIGSVWDGINISQSLPFISQYNEDCKKNCGACPNARFCDLCYISAIENDHFNFKRKYKLCENRIKHLNLLMYIYTSVMEQNCEAFANLQDDF